MVEGRALFPHEKYVNLKTFRRNGEAVATPLWFAEVDGTMYARTFEKTGKVRRLGNDPRVLVAPSDARGGPKGAWVEARARIVEAGSEEARHANRLLDRKYGLTKRLTEGLFGLRYGRVVTLAITSPTAPS